MSRSRSISWRAVIRGLVLATFIGGVAWGALALTGQSASSGSRPGARSQEPGAASEASPSTVPVRSGPFEIALTATGRLRAHRTVTVLTPSIEGKITYIAPDGAPVKQGQVICRLDDTDLRRALREETLRYENARAEQTRSQADRALETRNNDASLLKIQEEFRILKESNEQLLKQARAQLSFDEANLKRAQSELAKKKRQADERLIPREQVELAEIDLRAKEFALDKGQKELKLQENKAISTERQKQIELENAQVAAQTAQRKTGDESTSHQRRLRHRKREMEEAKERVEWCTIRAPASGLLVLSRRWQRSESGQRASRVGDQVWGRSQLGEIPDLSRMVVVARVPEQDIGGVRLGATARVRLEEDPERVYRATVTRISSVAEEVSPWETSGLDPGTRTFTVILDMNAGASKQLLPGVTANVEIVGRQIPKALFVPKHVVFDEGDRHVVYRATAGGRFAKVPVKPGDENEQFVIVRGPVRAGDRLATEAPQ